MKAKHALDRLNNITGKQDTSKDGNDGGMIKHEAQTLQGLCGSNRQINTIMKILTIQKKNKEVKTNEW